MSLDIRQKIQEFVKERPEYLLYEESQILSIMVSEGRISKQDVEKAKATSAFGFGFASITDDYNWGIEKNSEVQVPLRAKETPKPKKGYTKAEYYEAMLFAQQYLFNSATTSYKTITNYKDGIGYISAGAVWHGLKNIVNIFDKMLGTEGVLTLDEAIENAEVEKKNAERLASFDKLKSGAFEFTFEKLRGIEFDVKKIQNFKEKSDNYLYAQTSKNQYEILEKGVKELKVLLAREKQLELYGQNIVTANKNQKTFDGRLIEILNEYCGNDEELKNILITEISKDISSKDELQEKFLEVLESLQDNAKAIYEKQLNGKSFEEYHAEYIRSYAETFNGKNPEEEVQAWIMSQEQGTQLIRIAGIIATTTLTGGSNLLANTSSALTKRYGTAVAQQIIKLGLTLEGTGAGLALDYANALTSKTGLTKEKNAEILNNADHSLPYAIFGAYVSGPFGDKIANALKSSNSVMPNILQSAISKSSIGAGFAGEVGLDIVFEAALNNTNFIEIIKSNVQGEAQGRFINSLMQMVVGGRAHSAAKTAMKNAGLDGYTIKPLNNGKYEVKSPDGKIHQATEADFAKIIGKVLEDEIGNKTNNKTNIKSGDDNTAPKMLLTDALTKEGQQAFYSKPILKDLKAQKYQDEADQYLDYLLKDIPESPSTKGKYVKLEQFFILPDGTLIRRRFVPGAKQEVDALGWPTGRNLAQSDILVFEIIEPNGVSHTLAALNKKTCAKAQKIFDYMETLEPIHGDIKEAQQKFLEEKKNAPKGLTSEEDALIHQATETEFAEIIGKIFEDEIGKIDERNKNEVNEKENNTNDVTGLSYEISRNLNRVKRAIQYVEDKTKASYQGTKRVVKGVSKLINEVSLDNKLKSFGIKNNLNRELIIKFLKNTPIESDEIYNGLLNSIKTMKDLQIIDNRIQYVLVQISNNNEKFDKSSLDIIAELSILQKKAGNNWNNKTAVLILSKGKNNTEKLEYIKEYNATIDAGYKFDNIESMLMCGIKDVDGRKTYEEILNNEFTQRTKGGLGIEYTAQKYFDICKDSDGKFSYEYWNILQNMDKENVESPEDIFKFLKNDNAEITRANVEIFIAKLKENPAEAYKYNSSIIEKCMTRDGKLDFSRLDLALTITKLGDDFDDSLVKNQDGSYNQNAINMVQNLQSNGFKNKDINNIFIAAKNHLAIVEGELYSQEIIQKAIELKNSGIKAHNIGAMLNDCLEDGKLDINLLENITPIVKDLDDYTITETKWLVPLLKNYNSEMQKQIVPQIQKLMQNGFSIDDIVMCNIFNFKGSYGSIVPENIINAAIQLKQAGLSRNIEDILTQARFDDGTLNTEFLKFLTDLKNKGFIEGDIDKVLAILTTEKGVFLKDNTEIVLSLLKEYKDSEFCNPPKTEKQKENTSKIYSGENRIKSDYVSERGDNIRLVNTLIKMSSDEAGKINLQVLENNKAKLSSLYNKLEPEDKYSFIIYAKLAANKQGSFDENFFNKIHELKYLDDGRLDPSYNQTIKNFLDACKDKNGNLDIQKYNDAVSLVKKHGLSKPQASSCIYLYEEFKPYQNKKFVYDLSITEKRQLQSLLLSYSNNLKGLSEIKNILKTDIIPTTDVDYCMLMKQLSQSLGDTNFVLNKQDLNELNDNITKLAQTLSSKKPIDTISVNMTYNDLLKRIKNRMSGLSESEKCKIYDYFGFSVKNNEIVGFPNYLGKNIESTDITNSFTKKVVQAVTVDIENFNKNNSITIKDNPELSQVLTSISKLIPEVYNKFSSPEKSAQTLKSLKTITENPTFAKLSDNEQQVLIIAALLKNSNIGTIRETAYCIYNVASKFNMSNKDRQNLYKLISMPDLISEYYNTKINEEGVVYVRFGAPTVKYNKKEVALDMLALEMKDNGLDNLSYLLFSTGDNNLITPELQSALKQRIFEIKSDDFILPQTHTQTIKEHLITQTFKGYKIQVANASEIPNFYAYVHTPDAGAVNHSSRTTKFSNFEEFKNIDSNAVICTSYISSDKSGTWLDNGFIFDIATGNEYVGMGHDIFSLGKNKKHVVAEYYRNKGLKALSGKGSKYSHRSFISSHLKDILHVTENSYSDLNINRRKLKNNLEKLAPNSPEAIKIQNQIAKIDLEIQRINEDYIARIDKVKSQIQSEQINLDEIRTVDPKLASAYEQFLARDNTGHKFGKEALMRNDYWNEVLVSNPKISAIYTKNIDKLPTEYLEKAQNENIPIVIINH